ncbi:MAG: lactate utilization protein LutB domain-containing protein, partial [Candidatus Dadabacteria bacterium]
HSYGWVYSGPIGAIINPQLMGIDKAPELPFASSLCGACRDVCPVKIDFPKVLLELRSKVVATKEKAGGASAIMEALSFRFWRTVVTHRKIYELSLWLSRYAQRPWKRGGVLRSLPYPFSRWTDERDFPAVSETPFRERWKEMNRKGGPR